MGGEGKNMHELIEIGALAILVVGLAVTARGSISVTKTPRPPISPGDGRGERVDTLDEVFEGSSEVDKEDDHPKYNPTSGLPMVPHSWVDARGNPFGTNSD